MVKVIKETVTTQSPSETVVVSRPTDTATSTQTTEQLIYFIFGALEVLLAFRLVLKIAGASLASGFVVFIYSISKLFILPFEGIFRRGFAEGVETTSVFEPATMVAIIVYAVVAWGIVMLVRILAGEKVEA